ncbi:hypothetical protein ABVF61_22085 [Roseibium sp. HPY-6]|uniref:LIC_10190 family membrane protein n=1 Tax=Roseibium sp. HPY-6 TaxID=3229852 RepID=UPI00338F8844
MFFFPLLGAFALGMIALVVNFFAGAANSFSYGIATALLIYGCCLVDRTTIRSVGLICLFAALCTPLAADMQPGPDGGLYHFAHQRWIREHEIIFGFAHLHARYGFSSFLEYINSLLWIGEAFKLLSYMSALYFVCLLSFIYFAINSKNNFIRILALFIGINLLIYDGYFIWKYGYADSAAGLTFALSILAGLYILVSETRENECRASQLSAFFMLCAMAVALKVSSILVALWAVFVFATLLWRKQISTRRIPAILAFPAVFTLLWLLRGVITTGCLLFPVSWTCLTVPWHAKQEAILYSDLVTAWARHPHTGRSSLEGWSWLTDYWLEANASFLIYLSLAAVVIVLLAAMAHRFFATTRLQPAIAFALVGVIAVSLILWFLKAPTDRFGIGIFLIAVPVIALAIFGAPMLRTGPHLRLLSFILVILLANGQGGFSIKGLSTFQMLTLPQTELVAHPVFGVHGKNPNDFCWAAKDCVRSKNLPAPVTRSGYLFFEQ